MSIGLIIAYFVGYIVGRFSNRIELRELRKKQTDLNKFTEYINTKGGE